MPFTLRNNYFFVLWSSPFHKFPEIPLKARGINKKYDGSLWVFFFSSSSSSSDDIVTTDVLFKGVSIFLAVLMASGDSLHVLRVSNSE